jgi:hypothetical protein
MEEQLSGWFPRTIKPVHHGVYEVRTKATGRLTRWFSCWSGEYWGRSAQTPEDAAEYCDTRSDAAEHAGGFEWRGVLRGNDGNF